jgi:hypothetical protein
MIRAMVFFFISMLVLGVAFGQGSQRVNSGAAPLPPGFQDKDRELEYWENEIAQVDQELAEITFSLIRIAERQKRKDAERRQAIYLLGPIENKESLHFLVENISLRLPVGIALGDGDFLAMWPCYCALSDYRWNNWNASKAILQSLGAPKSKGELVDLGSIIHRNLGRQVGVALILEESGRAKSPQVQKNLEALKKMVDPY